MYDKDMIYKCIECGHENVVPAKKIKDGMSCPVCRGYFSPCGFVIGIDFAKGSDHTALSQIKSERQVKLMDYKSVIHEQIRELQKVQDKMVKEAVNSGNSAAYASGVCEVAKTIEYLCEASRRWPEKN